VVSLRGFLVAGLLIASVFWGWDRGITRDGLVRFIDRNPKLWKADTILFTLGSFHELFNRNERALDIYGRVVKAYPKSPLADDALFGVAACQERLKRWAEATEHYKAYLEKYPNGKYSASVSKNLEYLRSR